MLSVLRRAPVVVLCLVLVGKPPVLAQAPAKGTEILWDRYGVPHIFAPDHASLFYAYGYAQMEAHSELLLRLYAQARGRGAEFYGEQYLDADRWVRTNGIPDTREEVGGGAEPGVRSAHRRRSCAGLNAWAAEHKADLSAEAKRRAAGHASKTSTRTACASSTTTGSSIRPSSTTRLARADVETHGSNEWAIAPSRSATGKAMLMSNSHLQWGDIHTYFEVQLTAPGVTSYGAVWVGFPVLRQCFTDYLGWTQTTNNPAESDLYRLTLKDGGYVLDGTGAAVRDAHRNHQGAGSRTARCATCRSTVRRSVHGPVVAERNGVADRDARGRHRSAAAVRAVLAHGPGARTSAEWQDGDADAATAAVQHRVRRPRRPHRLRLQRDAAGARRPATIASGRASCPAIGRISSPPTIVPYDAIPKVIDPPTGWVQNSNDMPWTSVYPMMLDSTKFAAGFAAPQGITQRAQRGTRILSTAPAKMTFEDVKAWKLSTHVETADQFVDEIVATREGDGHRPREARGRRAREVGSRGRSRRATARCSSTSS